METAILRLLRVQGFGGLGAVGVSSCFRPDT